MEAATVAQVDQPTPRSDTRAPTQAVRVLLVVGALGVGVAALTWRIADVGLGWLVTDAVLVGAVLLGIGRGRPRLAEGLLAGASLWLAGVTAWRASDWAIATALPASLVTLGMLALVSARRLRATALEDVGTASLDALRALPRGIADAARTPVRAVGAGGRVHLLGVVRGGLVGLPVAGAFTLLLSADGQFRHALTGMFHRSGEGAELAVWTVATTLGLLVAYAVLERIRQVPDPMAAVPAAWLPMLPYRGEGDATPSAVPALVVAPAGPRVRPLTWGVVLAQVAAVFGVYVGATGGTLFAGHDHLRARGTTTYSAYLHEGFTQVSVATLLAVACVVVGHGLMRPRGVGRGAPGGKAIAAVEIALLALVGVTLVSCAHRLALYEEAYGYTYLRLGVWLLQLGVAGLLAMTVARCVARGWRGWGTSLAWAGVAFSVLGGSIDADGWIAGRNVLRGRAGIGLDVGYLATLSEDARSVLPEVAALDRDAAATLAETWGHQAQVHRGLGWRAMRGLGARWR